MVIPVIYNLRRDGDDLVLVLDRKTLEAHGIDEQTPVEVSFTETSMIVTPASGEDRQAIFERALTRTIERYDNALRKLAE